MANEFKPTAGGKVSKKNAQEWIDLYEKEHRNEKDKDIKSIFFGKEFLQQILNTEGASGISFFFAKKKYEHSKKNDIALVLIPTKEDGTLIWPKVIEGKDGDDDGAYDSGTPCPPTCPTGTP